MIGMRWTTALILIVTASCRCGDPITTTSGALRFTPSQLDVGNVWLGGSKRVPVTLTLDATFVCDDVQLTGLSAPLFVDPASLRLEPADSTPIELVIETRTAGPIEGTLVARGCGLEASLHVTALGVETLVCPPDEGCAHFEFDPQLGRCVRSAVSDGTSCNASCVTNGQCVSGTCRGMPISCDDGEPCTIDACGSEGTCLHLPADNLCPVPAACAMAACDGGLCPVRPLANVWRGPAVPTDYTLAGSLLLDAQGALYWVERSERTPECVLVSASSATGRERFRQAFDCTNMSIENWLAGDVVVVAGGTGRNVFGFDTTSGALRWAANLRTVLAVPQGQFSWVARGTVEGPNAVVAVMQHAAFDEPSLRLDLVSFSSVDGALVWRRAGPTTDAWDVGSDGAGRFFIHDRIRGRGGVMAVDRMATLWSDTDALLINASGRSFSRGFVLDATSGQRLAAMPPATQYISFANARVGLRTVMGTNTPQYFAVDSGTPGPPLDAMGRQAFASALLDDDRTLFVTWPENDVGVVNPDGSLGFRCSTGGNFKFGLVTRDRVIGWSNDTLVAFWTPGVLPGSGWWLPWGNEGAQNAPQSR